MCFEVIEPKELELPNRCNLENSRFRCVEKKSSRFHFADKRRSNQCHWSTMAKKSVDSCSTQEEKNVDVKIVESCSNFTSLFLLLCIFHLSSIVLSMKNISLFQNVFCVCSIVFTLVLLFGYSFFQNSVCSTAIVFVFPFSNHFSTRTTSAHQITQSKEITNQSSYSEQIIVLFFRRFFSPPKSKVFDWSVWDFPHSISNMINGKC